MCRIIKIAPIITLLVFSGLRLYTQRNTTWTFGDGIYMKFGQNGPEVDSTIATKYFFEMGSCISDEDGNLILFANHDSVYGAQGENIANISHGSVSSYSISQGILVLPSQGDDKEYFIPAIRDCGDICYSLFTLEQLNGGFYLKDFSTLHSGQPLQTEKQVAIRHGLGNSWWTISHLDQCDTFLLAKIESPTNVELRKLKFGQDFATTTGGSFGGQMIANQSGTRIGLVGGKSLNLYDFDRCIGVISNWVPIDTVFGTDYYYGGSFSPDGTKLYASTVSASNHSSTATLYQFDLTSPDIPNSKTEIFKVDDSLNISFGQHQLGPDGKIYITQRQDFFTNHPANFALSVINNPNAAGLACDFEYLKVPTHGKRLTYNLPNFPNFDLGPIARQTAECGPDTVWICPGDSIALGHPDTTGGKVIYAWYPSTAISATNGGSATVWPSATTTYRLIADDTTSTSPCAMTEDSVVVVVLAPADFPTALAGPDTVLCLGDSFALGTTDPSGGVWQYAWAPANGLADSTQPQPQASPSAPTAYTLKVRDPRITGTPGGCATATATATLTVEQPLMLPLLADAQECPGIPLTLGHPAQPGVEYRWSPATHLSDTNLAQPTFLAAAEGSTTYILTATQTAQQTRCATWTDTLTVTHTCPDAGISLLPNPTATETALEIRTTGTHTATWQLTDAQGRRVAQGHATFTGYLHTEIGLQKLAQGIYHLRLEIDGAVTTHKLMKAR